MFHLLQFYCIKHGLYSLNVKGTETLLPTATERATLSGMKYAAGLIIALLLFCLLPGTGSAFGAAKKTAKPTVKKVKIKKSAKTPPRFIGQPTVAPIYVTNVDDLPILRFSADRDVSVEVEPWMGNGRQRLTGDILVATNLKKGVELDVPWTVSILSNGKFNFHITMTDKAGNRTEYNAPFRVSFMSNQNRSVVH